MATLIPVPAGPAVIACNTCRYSADSRDDVDGVRGGAQLSAALHSAKSSDRAFDGIAVHEMPCLFACQDFCTVHLRAPDKVGYVLGRFEPTAEAARAILEYAALYADSEIGQVPFRHWPAGVKGHFITRTPPAGFIVVE